MERRRSLLSLIGDTALYHAANAMRARAARRRFKNIFVPVDDIIGKRVFSTGEFESTEFDALERILDEYVSSKAVAIDIGANIGLFSITFASQFAEVYSFEANPITAKVLEANLMLSGALNVRAIVQGVSDAQRTASLKVPKNGNFGWATLSDYEWPVASEIPVELDTLDNFAAKYGISDKHVGLVKIDVEGHEANVLAGGKGLLSRHKPVVLFEILKRQDGMASIDLLRSYGYDKFVRFRRTRSLWPTIAFEPLSEDLESEALVCAMKA